MFSWNKKTKQIFSWLDFIVMGLHPCSFSKNDYIKKRIKEPVITINALKMYMAALTKLVETKISGMLPNEFSIVFYGWSASETHYLTMLAALPSPRGQIFEIFRLAF